MKAFAPLAVLSGLLYLVPAASAQPARSSGATDRDLQRLQDALSNLDESLADLDPEHPRTGEFQERAADIREELVWLKVEIRRHQRTSGGSGWGASRTEVEEVRRSIVALEDDVNGALRRASARPDEAVLEAGTEIQVRLEDRVSSATARREDRVDASVAESVRVDGRVVIPAGATIRGIVTNAEPARRPSNGGRLELAFDQVEMANGRRADIRSRVVSIDEGGISKKRAGIGAGLGGVLGGILGGKEGALIGVLVGGGGAVVGSKGGDVELPAGTVLSVRLDQFIAAR
jgi:hypothetical protein